MTSSEITQIKKLESVKYLDIASKNDLGNDLNVTFLVTNSQNGTIPRVNSENGHILEM